MDEVIAFGERQQLRLRELEGRDAELGRINTELRENSDQLWRNGAMLALKTALASQDDVPVLVFDEVDANVGGETANAVGRKMRQLGEQRQVLCIRAKAKGGRAKGVR